MTRLRCIGIALVTMGCGSPAPSEAPIVDDSSGSSHHDDREIVREEARSETSVAPVGRAFAPSPVADARRDAVLAEFAEAGDVSVFGRLPGEADALLATIVRPPEPYDDECPECEETSSDCSRTRLVRVLGQGTPGSPLRIEGELRSVCPATDLSNVEIADFDGDGKLELRVVSRIELFSMGDSRSGAGMPAGVAVRAVYASMELRPQASLMMSERYEDTEGGDPGESSEARVRYEDLNGDGYMDLAIHRFYASYICDASDITQATPDDADCNAHASRGAHYYDPAADSWGDFVELEATRVEYAED